VLVVDGIPGDKSISHRAIIIGALAHGESVFNGFLCSEDCLNTLAIFRQLGVQIAQNNTQVTINGKGPKGLKAPSTVLDVGNSGTAIRLISGVLSALPFSTTITGDASIQSRPMGRIIDPLTAMGAGIESKGQLPPLTIHGTSSIVPNFRYTLPVASAQVKSAVLLASVAAGQSVSVVEPEPCRDHTERMLALFGASVDVANGVIQVGHSNLQAPRGVIQIPKDISSALFFIVWAALAEQPMVLNHIGLNASRTRALDVCRRMGVAIDVTPHDGAFEPMGDVTVHANSQLVNLDVPEEWVPNVIDELPILSVLATKASGVFRVRGAAELRVKESDRIDGICRLIRALGGHVEEYDDGFDIHGPINLNQGMAFDAKHDHRLAMSALIAQHVYGIQGPVHGLESIPTSFPNFMALIQAMPAQSPKKLKT
jgi:3-phosphoshikimate 1-carboxyvinyltransferase